MPNLASNLRLIAVAFEMTLKRKFSDAFMWFGIIIQPMLVALLALWMLNGGTAEEVIYVVVGSGLTGLWTTLLFESGNSITGERWTGTLENLVASPASLHINILGKLLANTILSLLSMVVCYGLASMVLGSVPTINHPFLFGLSMLIAIIGFVGFGLILAPIFLINPDVQRWQNGLEFPIYIVCGFLFPIILLPAWTNPFSYVLSMYWAARAIHTASSGTGDIQEMLFSWGMMLLLTTIYVAISGFLFRKLIFKARVDATLGLQ